MTVGELIKQLQQYNKWTKVVLYDQDQGIHFEPGLVTLKEITGLGYDQRYAYNHDQKTEKVVLID
jgi:hypothetical protein